MYYIYWGYKVLVLLLWQCKWIVKRDNIGEPLKGKWHPDFPFEQFSGHKLDPEFSWVAHCPFWPYDTACDMRNYHRKVYHQDNEAWCCRLEYEISDFHRELTIQDCCSRFMVFWMGYGSLVCAAANAWFHLFFPWMVCTWKERKYFSVSFMPLDPVANASSTSSFFCSCSLNPLCSKLRIFGYHCPQNLSTGCGSWLLG